MLSLLNTPIPMHLDRLYASEGSTQAPYSSARLDINQHSSWRQQLMQARDETEIIQLLNPNGSKQNHQQNHQHSIDSYLLHVYIHERHHPPFTPLTHLIGAPLTISYATPSGITYRHLHTISIRQLDHDGSFGYYRLLAQPITYQLHQYPHCHVDTDTSILTMIAERLATLTINVIDDTDSSASHDWTPARMTQWQLSNWAHICERLSRQGLTGFLCHEQTLEHTPPSFIVTTAYPSEDDAISRNVGAIRYHQVLHDRVQAPVLAISQKVVSVPASVTMTRFNTASVSHLVQLSDSRVIYSSDLTDTQLTLDSPAAFAPVTDSESVDDAAILADSFTSLHNQHFALAHATDLNVADTFTLTGHTSFNHHFRATRIVHLARNSLTHITGLTISDRHAERHASTLEAGSHLTQLRLILADTPWVGPMYSRQSLPPMTGITEAQSDTDSRDHMTPTKLFILDTPAQPIHRLEAQAGANYGTHFTHRADDQTMVQSIGDGEHLINSGSLLSATRPSLFVSEEEQAVESGYRHSDDGVLSEWVTDHRDDQAYSQLNVESAVRATLKTGVVNPASGNGHKREGINANTSAQVAIKSGEAMVLSSQPQTHEQSGEHDYQQHTPTLTQTSLGGQHLNERLVQLSTGLGRQVNGHSDIKDQLEAIAKEQEQSTHHSRPYTLIDSGADSSYVSETMIVHRSMGEMLSTTQQNMTVSSGNTHTRVSSEALIVIADGSVSMTNAKENIVLSAHTGKLKATAKQDVNIASSTKEVEVVAQNKITLNAGGARITLEGGDITIEAKQFTEKAGKHSKASGGFDGLGLGGLPDLSIGAMYKAQFRFADDDDIPYVDTPYIAINERTKDIYEGSTNEKGETETFYSSKPDEIKAHLKLNRYKAQFRFTDDFDIPYGSIDYIAQATLTGELFEGVTNIDGYTEIMTTSIEQEIKIHLNHKNKE